MAITASYSSVTRKLTVSGDALANSILFTRDVAGTLFVNAGAVPVTGGPATIVNTDLIEAFGFDLDDVITLDETNGVLPAADLFGGNGNDSLTGGSNGDRLFGEAGNDVLLGRGGSDQLFGGADNDTLTGGTGADTMNGEAGNDRMIWNGGDGSDVMEGGTESDIAEVNGSSGAEVFTVTANGARVRFDRLDPAPFVLDIGTTESLVLNAGGGNDSISCTGNLAALIALTLDGGAGNDTILGSNGADVLLGQDGDDFVDGQQGGDVAFLGAGDDVFQWDPGDGSDIIEGQANNDRILFNGSAGAENFDLSANGGRLRFARDLGTVVLDADDVEAFTLNALGNLDNVVINDLSATDTTEVVINLSGTIGGTAGDAQVDTVSVFGSSGSNSIIVAGAGTSLTVTGLPASVAVNQVEFTDLLTINGGGGNDGINASTVAAGIATLTLDGGLGDDTIFGSAGADTLFGGDNNDFIDGNTGGDTAFLGAGNDIFNWDPGDGSDVVEGQAGTDELRFNGSATNEVITIQPNGGRALFQRDIAAVVMDLDDIEVIRYRAFGGTDTITVASMAGTDVTQVILDLSGPGGASGDGVSDRVTVQATDGADTINVSLTASLTVSGLAASTRLDHWDSIDRLVILGNGGDDTINTSGVTAGQITFELLGGLGADIFVGSAGVDLINGGDGNDTAFMGAGDDVFVWNPGDDNDVIEGQAGTDRLEFNGSAAAEGINIFANGGRVIFFRDIAAVTMDLDDVEQIVFNAGAGTDAIVVNDLSGTDVTSVTLNLAGTVGGVTSDAVIDQITLFGDGGNESITLLGTTGALAISGLPAAVNINQLDASDLLTVNGGAGNDAINASQVASGVVTLTINGGIGEDVLTGGAGNDVLNGDSGHDVIDGGAGTDMMTGGIGNDVYVVRDASDSVTEAAAGGSDEVISTVSWTLGAGSHVEVLIVADPNSTNAVNLTGNALAQTLRGNAGFNILDGAGGDDVLVGLGGDDFFVIRSAADQVQEAVGQGNDRVFAYASWTLNAGAVVETLSTFNQTTFDAINLKGNEFNQFILGNEGANRLDSGGGIDTLEGRGGADVFAFTGALGAGNLTTISDFLVGTDKLAFGGISQAQLAAGAFRFGATAQDADDRIMYDSTNGRLFYDGDGNGAGAAIHFGTLLPGLNLSANDFVTI